MLNSHDSQANMLKYMRSFGGIQRVDEFGRRVGYLALPPPVDTLDGVDIVEGRVNDDFSGRRWQVEVMGLEEANERDGQAGPCRRDGGAVVEHAERIVAHLGTLNDGEGMCVSPLAATIGLNNANCRSAIERLVNQGRAEWCPVQSRNGAHQGVRLTAGGAPERPGR